MTRDEAIAKWQAAFHPDAIAWLERGVLAHQHFEDRNGPKGVAAAVAALVEMAKVCAVVEDERENEAAP